MKLKIRSAFASTLAVALLSSGVAGAPSAQAVDGTNSLAAVLTAKSSYDTDKSNYDILTAAVLAVLQAKPASSVKVLTDGNTALTAFIPNDGAFIDLVTALTGTAPASEQAAFTAVAGLGIDTVESVLLYHVVPGAAIASEAALKANGATLTTALTGKTIAVSVKGTTITLGDYDKLANDPTVVLEKVDINKGNKQLAHGINGVLLPVALLKPGTKSLAEVLTAKSSFDKNKKNYDVLTAAILAVLKAKPDSAVKVLTDGNTALTAFIPNDGAFLNLVKALTGKKAKTEAAALKTVASLGIPKVEQILLYHVVPGDAILSGDALKADGASLQTAAAGKVIKVGVKGTKITLTDYNKKLKNPVVLLSQVDINKGNKQVAHGIDAVLMPTR
jgi:uncharacterized surface protein with fasciclin (FAS1) repeats